MRRRVILENAGKKQHKPRIIKGLCYDPQWLARMYRNHQRRGQDSNLRGSFPPTGLANRRFRPLSHLSKALCRKRLNVRLGLYSLYTTPPYYLACVESSPNLGRTAQHGHGRSVSRQCSMGKSSR